MNEACEYCAGTGYIVYKDDPSPAGVSLSPGSMWYSDSCPKCLERGLCPRCGAELVDGEWSICPSCGWDEKEADKNFNVYAVQEAQSNKYDYADDEPF